MDQRMVEFIRALRAMGIRISIAESQDAMYGVDKIGIENMDYFRNALKSTLVKEHNDQDKFEEMFPLFFTSNQPPLQDIMDQLTPEQQELLQQAMQALMGDMDAARNLLQQMMRGEPLTDEQLQQLAEQAGLANSDEMYQRAWFEGRMNRQSGLAQLERMLDDLLAQLEALGMSQEALDQLEQTLRENMQGISDQMSTFVGQQLAQQMAQRDPEERPDLLDIPFRRLSQHDLDQMRDEIRRLAARLRTRAAMRQKKAKAGSFDPRRTLRKNMRYGGVPMQMYYRRRTKKPNLVLICDLSTSMRDYVSFLLTLVYELQDQVRRTHSFIFISDLVNVTMEFEEYDSQKAVQRVMLQNPPGYYSTDLGNSLNTFSRDFMSTIDSRTTVIICGDGRNNYNNPRIDIATDIQRKAHRLFWFCPEPQHQWGTGDSDMHHYATKSDGVYLVRTMRDLANAVDQILAVSA